MNYDKIFQENPNIGRKKLAKMCVISEQEARILCRQYKGKRTDDTIKKGIAVGDIHYPYHDPACINILLDFIVDFDPDYFLIMGDQMDFDTISTYNKGKPKLTEGKRLRNDYRGFQRDVIDEIEAALSDSCEKHWFNGNLD